mmetsp:Transcript_38215/g.91877  ORF Transcript_38215/g.91877 Transcript_38215/m.91877 type:complete len:214 (-) Transcript_38215:107-748(-)
MSRLSKNDIMKVIILGDAGVGKTSLLHRYVNKKFGGDYRATIGVDFHNKEVVVDGSAVTMQLWDTAGQEKFQSLGNAFYRGADAVILVYDVTAQPSFEGLPSWLEIFLEKTGPPEPESFPIAVLGNKCDKKGKKVPKTKVEEFCSGKKNCVFSETSALDATGVEEAFEDVMRRAMARAKEAKRSNRNDEQYVPPTITLPEAGGHSRPATGPCC